MADLFYLFKQKRQRVRFSLGFNIAAVSNSIISFLTKTLKCVC